MTVNTLNLTNDSIFYIKKCIFCSYSILSVSSFVLGLTKIRADEFKRFILLTMISSFILLGSPDFLKRDPPEPHLPSSKSKFSNQKCLDEIDPLVCRRQFILSKFRFKKNYDSAMMYNKRLNNDMVINIQRRLHSLDLLPEYELGVLGENEIKAIIIFQYRKNILVDGKIGKVTLSKLFNNASLNLIY